MFEIESDDGSRALCGKCHLLVSRRRVLGVLQEHRKRALLSKDGLLEQVKKPLNRVDCCFPSIKGHPAHATATSCKTRRGESLADVFFFFLQSETELTVCLHQIVQLVPISRRRLSYSHSETSTHKDIASSVSYNHRRGVSLREEAYFNILKKRVYSVSASFLGTVRQAREKTTAVNRSRSRSTLRGTPLLGNKSIGVGAVRETLFFIAPPTWIVFQQRRALSDPVPRASYLKRLNRVKSSPDSLTNTDRCSSDILTTLDVSGPPPLRCVSELQMEPSLWESSLFRRVCRLGPFISSCLRRPVIPKTCAN